MRLLYEEIPGADREKVIEFHERQFAALLEEKGVKSFYSSTGRSCLLFRPSHWDSEIFSRRIAHIPTIRIHPADSRSQVGEALDALLRYAEAENTDCIIGRLPIDDSLVVPLFLKQGFSVSEVLVLMRLELEGFHLNAPDENVLIRPVLEEEVPLIQELIVGNYENHFSRDPRISLENSRRMFREWMKNCAKGRVDFLLTAQKEGRLNGFLALKLLREEEAIFGKPLGFVEMIVVDERHRGEGVAEALLEDGIRRVSHQCDEMILNVALENVSAINFYAKTGFKILSSRFTFHGWLEDLSG